MITPKIEEFLNHDIKEIKDIAIMVKDYIDLGMSSSEISEIMEDLLNLVEVENHVNNIERKILIEKAINAIKFIISNIP